MKIAITGATGFIGRYLVRQLAGSGHQLRCWRRDGSDVSGLKEHQAAIEWVVGELNDPAATEQLVQGCDALVHAALWRPGKGFMGAEGELLEFTERNILGTLRLVEAARRSGVVRCILYSTCAVYDKILSDRPLDETHPTWPHSHYGAHKAAIEKFVHSYGLGQGYSVCALRPTGVYGVAHPPSESKWFELVQSVVRGETVHCERGGKEVHAADVARATDLLLHAPKEKIIGEAFNCCDLYVSHWDVAHLAREIAGSSATIEGKQTTPKHQIVTQKVQDLGMQFGGRGLLEQTISELVTAAQ